MKALLIKDSIIAEIDLQNPDGATEIQKLIGGFFTSCFRVGRCVGYCDDEFLINGREDWNVCLGKTLRKDAPYPIGGPIVVVAVSSSGASVPMTPKELGMFWIGPGGTAPLPVLNADYSG